MILRVFKDEIRRHILEKREKNRRNFKKMFIAIRFKVKFERIFMRNFGTDYKVKSRYLMGNSPTDGKGPNGIPDDDYIEIGGAWGQTEVISLVSDEPGQEYFPAKRPRYE